MLLEAALRWASLGLFLAGAAALWWPRAASRSAAVFGAGTAALTVAAVLRWVQVGHPPIFGTYENTIASAWAVSLAVLWPLTRRRESAGAPLWLRLLALWPALTLVYGSFFRSALLPLTISERSLWVDVHVLFAWLAYALLLSASMRALAGLVDGGGTESDAAVLRASVLGFTALSLMLVVGAWYSYRLFAEWYKWEIVETIAAALWLGTGAVVHARLLLGWRGRRLYAAMTAVLPLLLLAFWVWSLYSGTYHFFDIEIIHAR